MALLRECAEMTCERLLAEARRGVSGGVEGQRDGGVGTEGDGADSGEKAHRWSRGGVMGPLGVHRATEFSHGLSTSFALHAATSLHPLLFTSTPPHSVRTPSHTTATPTNTAHLSHSSVVLCSALPGHCPIHLCLLSPLLCLPFHVVLSSCPHCDAESGSVSGADKAAAVQ